MLSVDKLPFSFLLIASMWFSQGKSSSEYMVELIEALRSLDAAPLFRRQCWQLLYSATPSSLFGRKQGLTIDAGLHPGQVEARSPSRTDCLDSVGKWASPSVRACVVSKQ